MAELIKLETEGTKEVHEVGLALKEILAQTKAALADGWQPGTDLPQILMGCFASLSKAIEGVGEAGEEFKAYPVNASIGALIPVLEGIQALLKKEDA